MMLANYFLESPIMFEENQINVLVIEEPCFLRQTMFQLLSQKKGNEEEWILSENGKNLPFLKTVEIITNPWQIEGDSRRILSQISTDAVTIGTEMPDVIRELMLAINSFAEDLFMALDYNATYEEIQTINPIIKMLGFKMDFETLEFPERILEYMKICRKINGTKLFIVFGIRSLLNAQEREKLYELMAYEKLQVLLVESHIDTNYSRYESIRIIDENICEL